VLDEFDLIIRNCATKISKHFTKLTAVINENNQYEFPSVEIHKSVIDRLIINDSKHFKKLLTHVRTEFKTHENEIRKKYPQCAQNIDRLWTEVNSLRKDQINIDHYMSDLRRHALEEYNELYLKETQQSQATQTNAQELYESKNKKKKNRKKAKKAMEAEQAQTTQTTLDRQPD
jgi:hypothetical protein